MTRKNRRRPRRDAISRNTAGALLACCVVPFNSGAETLQGKVLRSADGAGREHAAESTPASDVARFEAPQSRSGGKSPGKPEIAPRAVAAKQRDRSPSAADPGGQAPSDDSDNFIVDIQKALSERGLYEGPMNGILDSKTRTALKRFERKQGLPVTGRLKHETLSALGVSISE